VIKYNSEQLLAIKHDLGPLLILAGAGTGKTTTIIARIAELILKKNIKTSEILVLTYTVKAAENFKERLVDIVGKKIDGLQSYNYHAFSKMISMEFYSELGYTKKPELITDSDIYYLLSKHIDTINLSSIAYKRNPVDAIKSMKIFFDRIRDDLIEHRDLVYKLQSYKNDIDDNDEDAIESYKQLKDSIKIYPLFQKWKQDNNQLDFGDMILNVWNLINTNCKVLNELRKRYKHIIIDEFQDNNYALSKIISKIAHPNNSITVVGDDDQSIYSFRGANIFNIYDFQNKYEKIKNYKKIALMKNYRSNQFILNIGNSVIEKNSNRLDKGNLSSDIKGKTIPKLFIGDKDSQINLICHKIINHINNFKNLNKIAILCRTNIQCKKIKSILSSKGIPVNYRNDKLFEQPVIKNIISWINFILDTDNEYQSMIRVISSKFGSQRASLLSSELNYFRQKSLLDTIICQTNHEDIKKFCLRLKQFKDKIRYKSPQEFIWEVISFSGYYRISDDLEIRSINKFRSFVKSFLNTYRKINLFDLCNYININYDVNAIFVEFENDLVIPAVELMTVHDSKGKEFDTVFLPFLSSNSFPMNFRKGKTITSLPTNWKKWSSFSKDDKILHIEEERRLFYVAITRAKNNLYLFTTEKRRSKFISEINPKLYYVENILMNDKIDENENQKETAFENLYNNLINENFIEAHEAINNIERIFKNEKDISSVDKNINLKNFVPRVLKKPVLSSSSIETYIECPLKYKYQKIDKIEGKSKKPFFSLGNTIHKVLELFHSKGKKTFEEIMNLLNENWDSYGYEFEIEEKQYFEDAKAMLEKYYNYIKNKDVNVFSTEDAFSFELSNCIIKGRCDRIDVTNDNKISVFDYKTSKNKINEKDAIKSIQLAIYAIYVTISKLTKEDGRKLGSLPEKLTYLFLRFEEPEVTIQFDNSQLDEIKKYIESIASKILMKKFNPIKGFHCNHCDYKNLICTEWNNDLK